MTTKKQLIQSLAHNTNRDYVKEGKAQDDIELKREKNSCVKFSYRLNFNFAQNHKEFFTFQFLHQNRETLVLRHC